jgi:hypothetical protein
MKPTICLSDFYTILSEKQLETSLVVTGSLEPFTTTNQIRIIRAIFPEQPGPKGSWSTSCYWQEVVE